MEKLYSCSIYYIFPLCMEWNALEKSSNNSIALTYFAHTPLMTQQLVGTWVCGVISSKAILISWEISQL